MRGFSGFGGYVRHAGKRLATIAALVVATAAPASVAADAAVSSPSASASVARATAGTPTAAPGVHYARLQQVCPPPAPGRAQCMAIRRIPVKLPAGAPIPAGVRAYATPAASLSTGPAGGYTPSDLESLYRFNRTAGGAGQTVGIIDWYDDPRALADLNTFDRHYELRPGNAKETASSFRKVDQAGNAKPLPAPNKGTSEEISLDVETVRAVCQKCRILLVEARNGAIANLETAVRTAARMGATEITNSWGIPEPTSRTSAYQAVKRAFTHKGVVITASTGDDGWHGWDFFNYAPHNYSDGAAEIPASLPEVTAVGGTSLTDGGSGRVETVWNDNGLDDSKGWKRQVAFGATGGGCSSAFNAPSWQKSLAGYATFGCHGKRLDADISALGDPDTGFDVYDSYKQTQKWATTGGTSLSSPLIASMWALAGGGHGVANPTQTLYANAVADPSALNDVTEGGNGLCGGDDPGNCQTHLPASPSTFPHRLDCSISPSGGLVADADQCNAATGYDGPSGLGTPNTLGIFATS